jgi:hypothetical protein
LKLDTNQLFHVEMRFVAAQQRLVTRMTRNGQPFGPVNDAFLGNYFSDFQVDALAICSYSDEGQPDPDWAGSVLAHGTVDNLTCISPSPVSNVAGDFHLRQWRVEVPGQWNWVYTLERTTNSTDWVQVAGPEAGTGSVLILADENAPAGPSSLYRVRATRP